MRAVGTWRSDRLRTLNVAIEEVAEVYEVSVCKYCRADIQRFFGHLTRPNKQNIAVEIAKHVPALERYLPQPRKPWMSEDSRMGMFDATALALTFFHRERGHRLPGAPEGRPEDMYD
jgi:hypothetical protein